jgi:DNA-binding NtrC family response regulator
MTSEQRTVVLFENNQNCVRLISLVLSSLGINVIASIDSVEGALEALPSLSSLNPDMYIVDHDLDDGSGQDIVDHLREVGTTSKVMGYSAGGTLENVDEMISKGAPIKELKATIIGLLGIQ